MGGVVRGTTCALLAALALAVVPGACARVAAGYSTGFLWPADGVITSPFGTRAMGFHPGIDIGILRDLTVRAASGGRVVGAGAIAGYEGYGYVVVLDIGGGFSTIYGHLSRPLVQRGDVVVPGQVLGIAGCTGWCTGTHLHFELRDRGRPIDPSSFFSPTIPAF